jgi:hypothetical protein
MNGKWSYGMALAATLALVPVLAWAEGGGGTGTKGATGTSGSKSTGKGGTASAVITVVDVDFDGNSVTLAGGTMSPTKYTVNKLTKIMVNGQPGTLAEVEKGMKAHITTGVSGTIASRLEVETYTGPATTTTGGKTTAKPKGGG